MERSVIRGYLTCGSTDPGLRFAPSGLREIGAGRPASKASCLEYAAAGRQRRRMRQYLTLLFVALIGEPALAEGAKASNPKTILSCFQQQSLASICTKPCDTWAQSQPDFRYSLDICVANCRKQNPCVGRQDRSRRPSAFRLTSPTASCRRNNWRGIFRRTGGGWRRSAPRERHFSRR